VRLTAGDWGGTVALYPRVAAIGDLQMEVDGYAGAVKRRAMARRGSAVL